MVGTFSAISGSLEPRADFPDRVLPHGSIPYAFDTPAPAAEKPETLGWSGRHQCRRGNDGPPNTSKPTPRASPRETRERDAKQPRQNPLAHERIGVDSL